MGTPTVTPLRPLPFANTQWPVGESQVRASILSGMNTLLPPVHTGLRDQEGLAETDFPIFVRTDTSGPPRGGLGGDEFALLALAVLSVQNMQTVDVDVLGQPVQLIWYRVRLYSFVKADSTISEGPTGQFGYARVVRLRGLTAASVRTVLLQKPSLGTASGQVRLETVSAQMSDVQPVKGDRWVSGVYHEFVFQNEEATVGAPIGTAETFEVNTEILGRDA